MKINSSNIWHCTQINYFPSVSSNSNMLYTKMGYSSNRSTFFITYVSNSRSQWPRVLRRRSATARLLKLSVQIPPGAWMSVCCDCCVLSGRVLCDKLIPRTEESYRLRCVTVCALETSWMRRPCPNGGLLRQNLKKKHIYQIARL